MRGYIYARVSTQNQDYKRQLSELKLYAEQHDIEIVETFQEKVSGRKNIRPELERMKKSIVGNKNKPDGEKIDIILLWEISRLSRRMIDLQKNVFFFLDEGIRIYCKKDNWTTHTEDGKLDNAHLGMLSILASFAESEVQNTRDRIKSSISYRLSRGDSYATKPPFGYKIVDHKLVIKEEKKEGEDLSEAEIVRRIFNDSANGKSTHKIGIELRAETGNRNKWSNNTVLRMLKNPCYCGYAYFGKTRQRNELKEGIDKDKLSPLIKVETPAIVSKELWERSLEAITERKSRSKALQTYPKALLRGLLFCPICGHRYTYNKKLYQCTTLGTDKYDYCGAKGISVKNLDYAIWEMISTFFKNQMSSEKMEELKEPLLNEIRKLNDNINIYRSHLENLEKEIAEQLKQANNFLKKQMTRAYNLTIDNIGKIEDQAKDTEKLIEETHFEISQRNKKIAKIESSNISITEVTDKRVFCVRVIESIHLYTIRLDRKYLYIVFKNGLSCQMWYRYNRGNRRSYYAFLIDDGTVAFNWKQDQILSGLPKDILDSISDFTICTNTNSYFGEEYFGEFTYDEFWDVLLKHNYVHIIPE